MTTTNPVPAPRSVTPPFSPPHPARRREASVVLAGDQLVVYAGDFNRGLPCVADRGDGWPCRRDVLNGVYSGFWECHIRGADGYVSVYDTEGLVPAGQLLRQRCAAHVASQTPDAVPPSGEVFDPELHKEVIRRYSPYWIPDGVVEERRSLTLPAEAEAHAVGSPAPSSAAAPPVIEVAPPKPRPTALYRYWDDDDVLLYVGITGDLKHRERSHLKRSSWMEFVARSTVERFPSREDAETAEVAAIVAERPLFNAKHNESPEAVRRLVDYLIEHGRTDLLAPAVSRG